MGSRYHPTLKFRGQVRFRVPEVRDHRPDSQNRSYREQGVEEGYRAQVTGYSETNREQEGKTYFARRNASGFAQPRPIGEALRSLRVRLFPRAGLKTW